jgi:hypothetical protein
VSDDQLSFLPAASLARRSDVETSHAAIPAAEARASQQAAIMRTHRALPNGLIDDEVSVLLGEEVWRRCAELRALGLLRWKLDAEGRPITRTARSGRQARVSIIGEPL